MTCRCSTTPSQSVIYFILCNFEPNGLEWAARDVTRVNRADTLHDIISGELRDVRQIIETEFTPAGLSSRDVTDDMLAEAHQHVTSHEHGSSYEAMLARQDHARDLRKHEVV
jgi:hypothetical protein